MSASLIHELMELRGAGAAERALREMGLWCEANGHEGAEWEVTLTREIEMTATVIVRAKTKEAAEAIALETPTADLVWDDEMPSRPSAWAIERREPRPRTRP